MMERVHSVTWLIHLKTAGCMVNNIDAAQTALFRSGLYLITYFCQNI